MDNPSLMGFGTFKVYNSEIISNALRIGYRHFDLAEKDGSIFPPVKSVKQSTTTTTTKVL